MVSRDIFTRQQSNEILCQEAKQELFLDLKLFFETANPLTDPIARCGLNVLFMLDFHSIGHFSMHWRSVSVAMVGYGIGRKPMGFLTSVLVIFCQMECGSRRVKRSKKVKNGQGEVKSDFQKALMNDRPRTVVGEGHGI
jgi:hypothetical protein